MSVWQSANYYLLITMHANLHHDVAAADRLEFSYVTALYSH